MDRAGGHAGNRGDIDDGSALSFRHSNADTAGDEERAAQVDIDLAIPLVHPDALDPVHLAEHAGGVDEACDRPVRRLDIGDAADHGVFARHIERGGPQDRLRARQRLRCDIDDDNTPPLTGEQRRGRRTDAAAATGDENDTISSHCHFLYPAC